MVRPKVLAPPLISNALDLISSIGVPFHLSSGKHPSYGNGIHYLLTEFMSQYTLHRYRTYYPQDDNVLSLLSYLEGT